MSYKLMVIDDRQSRRDCYKLVLSPPQFDPVFAWKRRDFEDVREMPVDGYLLDVFLDKGDWNGSTAADLLRTAIQAAPRAAPVFLVSEHWKDDRVLDILKQAGDSSAKVVQYLAWSEFVQATGKRDGAEDRLNALRSKLLSELDRWHGQSSFRPAPNQLIRILMIADPQFGDPRTDPKATFAENWIAKKLRAEAYKDPEGSPIPDLIVLAGDVTHSGRPDQFALAEDRLTRDLMGALWGENNIDRMRDRIIVVPGNHDVNLRFSASDNRLFSPTEKNFTTDLPTTVDDNGMPYPGHGDYALEPFRRFAHRLTGHRLWQDMRCSSWVDRRFLHCGIRFFVLSSVCELNADAPDRASFSERATRAMTRSLADDQPDEVFSIAISHHGLRPPGADNEKGVENWTAVGQDFFALHRIRMWFYGHYHAFDARSLNGIPFNDSPLWLVQIPTTRIFPSTRGFCVLDLIREAGVVTDAHVHQFVMDDGATEKRRTVRVFGRG